MADKHEPFAFDRMVMELDPVETTQWNGEVVTKLLDVQAKKKTTWAPTIALYPGLVRPNLVLLSKTCCLFRLLSWAS